MTDKIYLLLRILGPKVDVEDIHCVLDFAGHDVSAMNPRDAIGGGGGGGGVFCDVTGAGVVVTSNFRRLFFLTLTGFTERRLWVRPEPD